MSSSDSTPMERVLAVCAACKVAVVLGTRTAGSCSVISHRGTPTWQHPRSNQALWRFVAEHTGHRIEFVVEGATRFADTTAIPADLILVELDTATHTIAPDDLTVRDYLRGWPDQPQHPAVHGPRRYTMLHPHPEHAGGYPREHERATRRPGIPAAPSRDRPLHVIPGLTRPRWLNYLLHYHHDGAPGCWILSVVPDLGCTIAITYNAALCEHAAGAARKWARRYLEAGVDENDRPEAVVTDWRLIQYGSTPGWVPLFDTTERGGLPWTDFTPATGSRPARRLTPAAGDVRRGLPAGEPRSWSTR